MADGTTTTAGTERTEDSQRTLLSIILYPLETQRHKATKDAQRNDYNLRLATAYEIEDRRYGLFRYLFCILLGVYLHKSLRLKDGHEPEVLIH